MSKEVLQRLVNEEVKIKKKEQQKAAKFKKERKRNSDTQPVSVHRF